MNLIFFAICVPLIALNTSIYSVNPSAMIKTNRQPEVAEVDSLFLNRWSARAMSGQVVTEQELMPLFEAARWAPSSSNEQPWRFIYAYRGTGEWDTMFDLLVPFNQEWCKNGSVLVVMVSKRVSKNGGVNRCHSFDTGAAWQNLTLQGYMKGLVVHGMGGFDYERAQKVLNIPNNYQVEAMCVIGKPADVKVLSTDLQAREKPSGRKALYEIVCEGTFNFKE